MSFPQFAACSELGITVVVSYHKYLLPPKNPTETICNMRVPKTRGKAITYLQSRQAQVNLTCIFHLGLNNVFKKLFWKNVRSHRLKASSHSCVLWWCLPPCLLLNWTEASYTFGNVLILQGQQIFPWQQKGVELLRGNGFEAILQIHCRYPQFWRIFSF